MRSPRVPVPWWRRALSGWRGAGSLALCLIGAVFVAIPLWTHRWLPIQDLPQHLAALRVVHEAHFGGPTKDLYVVDLTKTQYILFYVLGDLLACFMTVKTAGLVMITAYMLGTVAATYALLHALRRDPRLSLLVVPLLTNSQFLLGLIQFLIGLPLMLWGWSVCVEELREPKRWRAVLLGVIAVLAFYAHIVIFGVFVIGVAIIAPWRSYKRLFRFVLPLVPSGMLLVQWALFTRGGDFVRSAMTNAAENKDVWPFGLSFHESYKIAFDSYRDGADEKVFTEAALIGAAATVLAVAKDRGKRALAVVSTARWLLIPLVCAVLYVRSEGTNGYLAHIRDRFPVLALFALIPALRMPRGWVSHVATAAMLVVAGLTGETFNWHLARFDQEDVGDFDRVLAAIPPNKRVAGLVYKSESLYFGQNPMLHFASYYLVERGGAASFSFAGYPHWVFGFAPHKDALGASPPVFLWEWRPDKNRIREELAASYDYVLTRGYGFDPPDGLFVRRLETAHWTVWERRTP